LRDYSRGSRLLFTTRQRFVVRWPARNPFSRRSAGAQLRAVFEAYDAGRSGRLERGELAALFCDAARLALARDASLDGETRARLAADAPRFAVAVAAGVASAGAAAAAPSEALVPRLPLRNRTTKPLFLSL